MKDVRHVLKVLEVIRCVLLRVLEAVEGGLCLLEALGGLEIPEMMCCMLLRIAGGSFAANSSSSSASCVVTTE